MRFSELHKLKQPELIVSNLHDEWIVNDGEFSEEAMTFLNEQMHKTPRERTGTVSASSLGYCVRRQQFTFLGLPQRKPEARTMGIFRNGDFMHLRWQMSGISAGWLKQAEVSVPENKHDLAGTMDGILYEDSIVEFKSINENGYKNILAFGPQKNHLMQAAAYVISTGRERVSFIYENKNTQEYVEYVRTAEELPVIEAMHRADDLRLLNAQQVLAEPLDKCIAGEGIEYKYCPFRDVCFQVNGWDEAERAAK